MKEKDRKKERMDFRLTKEEKDKLRKAAKANGLPIAEYVRRKALEDLFFIIQEDNKPDITSLIDQLSRIGNNLNQLTRLANSGKKNDKEILKVLNELLKKKSEILTAIS